MVFQVFSTMGLDDNEREGERERERERVREIAFDENMKSNLLS